MGWFTKIVEVEKVVEKIVEVPKNVYLLGDPIRGSVYRCYSERLSSNVFYFEKVPVEHGYFKSCKEAFKAFPGSKVEEITVLKLDGEYFKFSPDSRIQMGAIKPTGIAKTP